MLFPSMLAAAKPMPGFITTRQSAEWEGQQLPQPWTSPHLQNVASSNGSYSVRSSRRMQLIMTRASVAMSPGRYCDKGGSVGVEGGQRQDGRVDQSNGGVTV